jgi:hypothetical protein
MRGHDVDAGRAPRPRNVPPGVAALRRSGGGPRRLGGGGRASRLLVFVPRLHRGAFGALSRCGPQPAPRRTRNAWRRPRGAVRLVPAVAARQDGPRRGRARPGGRGAPAGTSALDLPGGGRRDGGGLHGLLPARLRALHSARPLRRRPRGRPVVTRVRPAGPLARSLLRPSAARADLPDRRLGRRRARSAGASRGVAPPAGRPRGACARARVADVVGRTMPTRPAPGPPRALPRRGVGRAARGAATGRRALARAPPGLRPGARRLHGRGAGAPLAAQPRQPADAGMGGPVGRHPGRPLPAVPHPARCGGVASGRAVDRCAARADGARSPRPQKRPDRRLVPRSRHSPRVAPRDRRRSRRLGKASQQAGTE